MKAMKDVTSWWVFFCLLIILIVPSCDTLPTQLALPDEVVEQEIYIYDYSYEDQFADDLWDCEMKSRKKHPKQMLKWDNSTRECLRKEKGYMT